MNVKGNIRKLQPGDTLADDEILIGRYPDKNCKNCYGRGYVIHLLENIRKRIICGCTKE